MLVLCQTHYPSTSETADSSPDKKLGKLEDSSLPGDTNS